MDREQTCAQRILESSKAEKFSSTVMKKSKFTWECKEINKPKDNMINRVTSE